MYQRAGLLFFIPCKKQMFLTDALKKVYKQLEKLKYLITHIPSYGYLKYMFPQQNLSRIRHQRMLIKTLYFSSTNVFTVRK